MPMPRIAMRSDLPYAALRNSPLPTRPFLADLHRGAENGLLGRVQGKDAGGP